MITVEQYTGIAVGVLTLIVNALVIVIGGTWKLSEIQRSIMAEIATSRDKLDAEISADRKLVADSFFALREHVHRVHLDVTKEIADLATFSRDTYIRRDYFHQAMNRFSEELKSHKSEMCSHKETMEERARRLDEKMERLAERARV